MIVLLKEFIPNSVKLVIKRFYVSFWQGLKYSLIREKIIEKKFNNIIFVCQGNVCRSAFAEFYLQLKTQHLSMKIESCGLNVYHDGRSPATAIKVSQEFGVDLGEHLSKSYTACDFDSADLIVPMEFSQYLELIELLPDCKNKIHLLRDFLPFPLRLSCNIYDPYGLGESEFKRCFAGIIRSIDYLLIHQSNV